MMNVVNSGSKFQIYGEDVKTYKSLPNGSYEVAFNKFTGFYLSSRPDLITNEDKIYGNHLEKVQKVMNGFKVANRNFGIILSGQKGIGKSLFARILATEAIKVDMPVIVVSGYIPGIADFISSIEQEVVVIFDEFEKTFAKIENVNPQDEMLSLFDGIDGGKKLFVITCNETSQLSSYMLNRPGRFHYHFKITNPTDEEISDYLHDKLLPQYHDVIEQVINFAHGVNMTYDCLRAIVFELNQGYSLKDSIRDLNISDIETIKFDLKLTLTNGMEFHAYGERVDLTRRGQDGCWMHGSFVNGKSRRYYVRYRPIDIIAKNGMLMLEGDKIMVEIDDEDLWELSEEDATKAKEEFKKNIAPAHMTFTKVQTAFNGARFIDV